MALIGKEKIEFLANGTVLDQARFRGLLLGIAVILSVLFTSIEPECTAGLSLVPRFVFWSLQTGFAIAAIMLACFFLQRVYSRPLATPVAVLITGVLGAMLAAPVFVALEGLFGITGQDDIALLQGHGLKVAIAAEFLDIVPSFVAVWALTNLPLIVQNAKADAAEQSLPVPHRQAVEPETKVRALNSAREDFLDSLPEMAGRDLVAVSSDLHYLNVHTSRGKTVVLGSVSRCAEIFGDEGMLVHRANWVSKKHVTRVVVSSTGAYCLMSTGLKVPISRSRRKEVKQVFGGGVKLHSEAKLA